MPTNNIKDPELTEHAVIDQNNNQQLVSNDIGLLEDSFSTTPPTTPTNQRRLFSDDANSPLKGLVPTNFSTPSKPTPPANQRKPFSDDANSPMRELVTTNFSTPSKPTLNFSEPFFSKDSKERSFFDDNSQIHYRDWFHILDNISTLSLNDTTESKENSESKENLKKKKKALLKFALTNFQLQATYLPEDLKRLDRQTSPLVLEGYARGIKTGLWEIAREIQKSKLQAKLNDNQKKIIKNFNIFLTNRPFDYNASNNTEIIIKPKEFDTIDSSVNLNDSNTESFYIKSLGLQLCRASSTANKGKEAGSINQLMGAKGLRTSPNESAEIISSEMIEKKKPSDALKLIINQIKSPNNKPFVNHMQQIGSKPNNKVALQNSSLMNGSDFDEMSNTRYKLSDPATRTPKGYLNELLRVHTDFNNQLTSNNNLPFFIKQNIEILQHLIGNPSDFFKKTTSGLITALFTEEFSNATELIKGWESKHVGSDRNSSLMMEEFYQSMQNIHHLIRFQASWNNENVNLKDTIKSLLSENFHESSTVIVGPHALAIFDQIYQALPDGKNDAVYLKGAYYETPDLFPDAQELDSIDHEDIRTKKVIIMEPHPNNAALSEIKPHDPVKLIQNVFENSPAEKRCTIVMDVTLNHLSEQQIKDVLSAAKPHIESGKLNLVLLQSGTKFFQNGMDLVNIGTAVILNDKRSSPDWVAFNTKMEASSLSIPKEDELYIAKMLSKDNNKLQRDYLDKVRSNTKYLRRALGEHELGNKNKHAFELCVNTDSDTVYIAFKPTDEFIKKQIGDRAITDTDRMEVNINLYKKFFLPTFDDLPSVDRSSFGFNITNFGECGETVRITLGIEETQMIDEYAQRIKKLSTYLFSQDKPISNLFIKNPVLPIFNKYFLERQNGVSNKGVCVALSWLTAVALQKGGENGLRQLTDNLNHLDKSNSIDADNFKIGISALHDHANKHYPLKSGDISHTFDDIISKLSNANSTAMYKLGTTNHAMLIGVTKMNGNSKYYFSDYEGLKPIVVLFDDINGLNDHLNTYFDADKLSRYQVVNKKFELTHIDVNRIADLAIQIEDGVFISPDTLWQQSKNISDILVDLRKDKQERVDLIKGLTDSGMSAQDLYISPELELMQKHGISDPVLHLMNDANQLDQLVTKQNDIRTEIQKIKPELTKDHILVYDAIEHKPNGDIAVHLVHRNGNQNETRLVDIDKNQNQDLINNISQVHKNYKKLASSPKWVNRVDKVDDTIGYIGLLNQYRAIIQGEQLHPATLEHQLIGYGQFAVANTQAATQVTTKACQYLNKMASTASKANQFMKVGSIVGKAGKALPVIGVALEGGSFALSVNDLVNVLNDSRASDLQKGQAISNVVLGGAGLTVSVITVGAMLAGASIVAGAATGVGLLLIPIAAGVGAIFEYYQDMESADQTYKYIGSITRAYDQGFVLKEGTLYSEYGAVVKKIDLRAGDKCIYFGSQTVESQKTERAWGDSSGDRYRHGSDRNTEKNVLFADSKKSIQGAVTTLVLPMTANQNLKYVYNDGNLNASNLDADGRRTMEALAKKGVANSYYYLGGSNTEREKKVAVSAYGIHPESMFDSCIEVFLDKQVKHLYAPALAEKLAHDKLTYALQGDGGQYTLTLADKVKFALSESTNSSSTWMLDSSNMVEKDDIQIQSNKLIIGGVELDVSKLAETSKLIIQRQNGDVCTIDLRNNTKTLIQMNGQEYVKRQADLSVDGYMLPKGDQYMLIKNYQHHNQNVGNAYYNSDKKQLLFSTPTKDTRQEDAVAVMNILDELTKGALYEIKHHHQEGTSTTYTPTGSYMGTGSSASSTIEHGSSFEFKEPKSQEISSLKTSIENANFQASHPSLYADIKQWLSNYDDNTQKISKQVSAQSKKWESNVKVAAISTENLDENSFLKKANWNASSAVSLIKQQQGTLKSLHEQTQQKLNPLYNAVLGGIDGNNRYFFNIQKGLAWQTNETGTIQKQYALPLATSEWDYKHLSFRQATNTKGEKLFLLDVIAHSRTGTTPISRSLTYQIGTNSMHLLVDHTNLSTHTHPSASALGQSTFEFPNVPQVTPKNSLDYVHFYNEDNADSSYWLHKGERVYADLPSDVSIQAKKYISMDRIQSEDGQPDLFYFCDQKNKKLYQQQGNGTTRDTTNPKAKLVGDTNQKITNAFVHNGFAWATDERGVTYQVGHNSTLDTIGWVNLDPVWLSANGKEDWITWLKSDLFQNITDKTHQIRIHGLKSQTADGDTYAWYENNKLKVVDLGKDLSFIGLDHTGNKAYLFNDQTGKLYQQAISELSNKNNDLSADGYALKNSTTNNILLPTWTFSKATVFDWKELVGSQNAMNKILSLEIKNEVNDQKSLSLLWDVKKNKKTLTIAHPSDITRHASLLSEVNALILLVDPHATDSAYTYNFDSLLTLAGKIKLITIKYQNTRSNTNIFDQLQYSATSTTKFGQLGNDLYITDERGTIRLQDVFTSEGQIAYQQLQFQISKTDSTTFSQSVWEVSKQLKDVEGLRSAIDFYRLSDFVNTGQLICEEKSQTRDIVGSVNDDIMTGSKLANTIYGLQGNDRLEGGDGNDDLYGQEGNDKLYGGEGRDALHGGTGNDQIWGGDNEDELYGEEGNDELYGGNGDDFYVFTAGDGHDIIDDGDGIDVIYFSQANQNNTYTFERSANNLIIKYGNQDQVTVRDHFDPTKGKSIAGIEFQNSGMIDLEKASEWAWSLSDQAIFKKDGDDLCISDGGDTFVLKNVFSSSNLSACTQLGLQLNDFQKYRPTFSAIDLALAQASTHLGEDFHHWYKWTDFLKKGVLINLTNDRIKYAIGVTNNATIIGDNFANKLYSEGDESVLSGMQGDDELYGGTGSDTYRFHGDDGVDTIVDSGGIDTIEFATGVDIKFVRREGNDLLIEHGQASSIRVKDHFSSTSAQQVEFLKLSNGSTYQIIDLVRQAEAFSIDKNTSNWKFSINALVIGAFSSTQVDVDSPSPITNSTSDTLDFSTWKGSKEHSATGQDLEVNLERKLWKILSNKKEGVVAGLIKNVIGSSNNEHFIGSDQANKIYGGGGRDVFEGGKGNDTLVDGTSEISSQVSGDSTYIFAPHDGQDEIWDWGGSDTIRLATFSKPKAKIGRQSSSIPMVSFLKDQADLVIKNNADTNSSIRVHNHFLTGRGIEYFEWGGESNRFDLSKLTSNLTSSTSQNYNLQDLTQYKIGS